MSSKRKATQESGGWHYPGSRLASRDISSATVVGFSFSHPELNELMSLGVNVFSRIEDVTYRDLKTHLVIVSSNLEPSVISRVKEMAYRRLVLQVFNERDVVTFLTCRLRRAS
jgi:hypothetical protein